MRQARTIQHAVVPATPGWRVGVFLAREGEHEPSFMWEEIVAWHVELVDRSATTEIDEDIYVPTPRPITAGSGGRSDGGKFWLLKSPDGALDAPDDCGFDSEQEALAYFQKQTDSAEGSD